MAARPRPRRPPGGGRALRRHLLLAVAGVSLVTAASVRAVTLDFGAYGGASVPFRQDDRDAGAAFGVRAPVGLAGATLEPFWARTAWGERGITVAGVATARDGGHASTLGVDLRLRGPSVSRVELFPYAGVGAARLTRSGLPAQRATAWDLGLGLAVAPLPRLALEARAEGQLLGRDGSWRGFTQATLGARWRVAGGP